MEKVIQALQEVIKQFNINVYITQQYPILFVYLFIIPQPFTFLFF